MTSPRPPEHDTECDTRMGIRDAVMGIDGMLGLGERLCQNIKRWRSMRTFMLYALQHPARRRRLSMDIPAMIQGWHTAIYRLSTGHSKDDIDAADFALDELMSPLLAAPVAQLRQFYFGLAASLKNDPAVPWFVWATFEAYGEVIVKTAPDQAVKELKVMLAREIAELVDRDVQPDIVAAITGALQWRDPETLEKVRDAVKNGEKPRLRGRQSCLFLEVAGHEVML